MHQRKNLLLVRLLTLLGGFLAAGAAGCGKDADKRFTVEGKVLFGDQPLKAGYITFYPDPAQGNASKEVPSGKIDAQGTYEIWTGTKKGAAPGRYKVAVTAADQIDPKNPYFTKWLIPERYIDPKTSKLTVEVVEQPAAGAYDFKLERK